jgi:hypothetical protein
MVWEGVPWMVDGGEHSAEVGRLLAYIASGSGEGIVSPTDCAVVASAIPDGNVHVNTGGVVMLNRFPGGGTQSYVARNVGDSVVALTPQGSGGGRTDLVAVIVEDPQYPGQPDPVSVADGPYVRLKVYEDVDPATRFLYEVDPDQTGYALALVTFNASDGTITQGEILDLRRLVVPRTQTFKRMYNEVNQAADGAGAYALGVNPQVFPIGAEWDVEVPEWATKMQLTATLGNLRVMDPTWGPASAATFSWGVVWIQLGDVGTETAEFTEGFNNFSGSYVTDSTSWFVADELDVPDEMRGTKQHASIMGQMANIPGRHNIGSEWGTVVVFEINFYEAPVV